MAANTYTTSMIRAIPEPAFGDPTIENDEGVYEYQLDEWQDAASPWLKVSKTSLTIWNYIGYEFPLKESKNLKIWSKEF